MFEGKNLRDFEVVLFFVLIINFTINAFDSSISALSYIGDALFFISIILVIFWILTIKNKNLSNFELVIAFLTIGIIFQIGFTLFIYLGFIGSVIFGIPIFNYLGLIFFIVMMGAIFFWFLLLLFKSFRRGNNSFHLIKSDLLIILVFIVIVAFAVLNYFWLNAF